MAVNWLQPFLLPHPRFQLPLRVRSTPPKKAGDRQTWNGLIPHWSTPPQLPPRVCSDLANVPLHLLNRMVTLTSEFSMRIKHVGSIQHRCCIVSPQLVIAYQLLIMFVLAFTVLQVISPGDLVGNVIPTPSHFSGWLVPLEIVV